MPYMPGGNYVPPQALQGGAGAAPAALASGVQSMAPAAQVDASTTAGPGRGGAATAEVAQQQIPQAAQAAGMAPQGPGAAQMAPGAPGGQGGATGAPGASQAPPDLAAGAPPASPPGFVPNSRGQQLYFPGQGPVTEQIPEEENNPMITAGMPQGAGGLPVGAQGAAGQMMVQAATKVPVVDLVKLGADPLLRLVTQNELLFHSKVFPNRRKSVKLGGDNLPQPPSGSGLTDLGFWLNSRGRAKIAAIPVGSNGPMTSTKGTLNVTAMGEGDTSALKFVPWSQSDPDRVFKDIPTTWAKNKRGQGDTTFKTASELGALLAKMADATKVAGIYEMLIRPGGLFGPKAYKPRAASKVPGPPGRFRAVAGNIDEPPLTRGQGWTEAMAENNARYGNPDSVGFRDLDRINVLSASGLPPVLEKDN